jgi:hypothetical protein
MHRHTDIANIVAFMAQINPHFMVLTRTLFEILRGPGFVILSDNLSNELKEFLGRYMN